MRSEQCLRMLSGRQVDGHVIRIGTTDGVQIHRRLELRPACAGQWGIRPQEVGEAKPAPPGDCAPPLDAEQPGYLLVARKPAGDVGIPETFDAPRGKA